MTIVPEIVASLTNVNYKQYLCQKLENYSWNDLQKAIESDTSFTLEKENKTKLAISWWVTPKRTRSYPFARVYDTLGFSGKRVTIIPVIKDEGFDGDRDFIQYDTFSLMSLLGIHVIISYYEDAEKNTDYRNKITNQRFDLSHVRENLTEVCSSNNNPSVWNAIQLKKIHEIGKAALDRYDRISKNTDTLLHSKKSAIKKLQKMSEQFMSHSRELAQNAQTRESLTIQPKENLEGQKAKLTIKDHQGGKYYWTCDEVTICDGEIYLIEGKHSSKSLPAEDDIKDGLLKLMLYSNLEQIQHDGKNFKKIPVLKLTSVNKNLNTHNLDIIKKLKAEAKNNNLKIKLNDKFLDLN